MKTIYRTYTIELVEVTGRMKMLTPFALHVNGVSTGVGMKQEHFGKNAETFERAIAKYEWIMKDKR